MSTACPNNICYRYNDVAKLKQLKACYTDTLATRAQKEQGIRAECSKKCSGSDKEVDCKLKCEYCAKSAWADNFTFEIDRIDNAVASIGNSSSAQSSNSVSKSYTAKQSSNTQENKPEVTNTRVITKTTLTKTTQSVPKSNIVKSKSATNTKNTSKLASNSNTKTKQ